MNTKPPMQTTPADAPGGDPSMEDILASIRRILSEDEAQPAALPKPPADAVPTPAGPTSGGQVPAIPQPPAAVPEPARGARGAGKPDVLVLDSSMMVQEPAVTPPDPTPAPTPTSPPVPSSVPQGNAVRSFPAGDGPKGAGPVEAAQNPPPRAPLQPAGSVPSPGSATSAGPVQPIATAKPLGAEPPMQLVAPEAAAAASAAVGTLMRTLAAERGAAVSRGGPTIEDLVRDELRPMLKAWLDAHLPPLVERLVRVEIERVVGRTAP